MARAARPAHLASPSGALLVTVVSLGLVALPLRARAEGVAASEAAAEPAAGEVATEPETQAAPPADAAAEPSAEGAAEGEAGPEGEDAAGEASDEAASESDEAGADEAADDEAADDDAADDDAAADAKAPSAAAPGALGPTAAPLRPMQTAAWWTMFGAFAVGTTAGVLAGLAERQEDRATRLSTLFDAETGAQPLYADRQSEYEEYLRRGEGYARAAIGVGVVAGAATIAAITLFAIDAKRQRGDAAPKKDERKRAAWRLRGGGVEVRF